MHNNLFKVPTQDQPTPNARFRWLLVVLLSLPVFIAIFTAMFTTSTAFAASNPTVANKTLVGQVSLLIGDTRVSGPQRSGTVRLQTGDAIYPGDIVLTRASGHAHLRFIDGALMSVRPSSRLTIEAYHYDPQAPENNRVSFTLEEGVARSISGKAAKDARENFRMNTPVAAIGVRGTDFIVQTGPERTRALVTEGGIVLSGLEASCLNGWCGELELRGGSQQLLEVDLATNEPRLMRSSFDEVITSTLLNSSIALVQVSALQEGLLAGHKLPTATSLAQVTPVQAPIQAPAPVATPAPVETAAAPVSTPTPAAPVITVAAAEKPAPELAISQAAAQPPIQTPTTPAGVPLTPAPAFEVAAQPSNNETNLASGGVASRDEGGKLINSELIATSDLLLIPEMSAQPVESVKTTDLVWGYLNTNQDTLPEFVQTQAAFDELNKSHHKTDLGNEAYALYRRNEFNQVINPFLPELQFALTDAAAWLNWHAYREPMDVSGGMLVIDFDRAVFSTQLQLNHERTGQIFFNASGKTENTGHFSHKSNNQNLQGIVSLNGKEAAYLFNQSLLKVEGEIDGITLWGIKK